MLFLGTSDKQLKNKKMRKTIFLSIIVCAVFGNAIAQTTKKESIKQLFVLMNQDSLMQQTFANIPLFANNPLTTQITDSTKLAKSKEVIKKVKQIMSELYPKIQADMIDYYDKYFTQEEINDYICFYSSAAGQKMIHVTPLIMKEMMTLFQTKYMNEIISSLFVQIVKPDVINRRSQYCAMPLESEIPDFSDKSAPLISDILK